MKQGMVVVPAAPVRKKPHHKYEMVNQLLFGEKVAILSAKRKGWVKIKSLYDGYKGWVTQHMIRETGRDASKNGAPMLAGALLNTILVDGLPMHIPMGAFIWLSGEGRMVAGNREYRYGGALAAPVTDPAGIRAAIEQYARQWLNAPYLWGGKTILGVDCSGFAQTIFKMAGIVLQRDAWQQAQEGLVVKKLQDARPGDLAFFDDQQEIVHVGILLGPDQIIHASGQVRIDTIDKKGIINVETGKRTHRLKLIKRMPQLT
ncbi:C40 family peptidase [Niabella drilacis]|uniref:SH3 domain-containing protein n=1 Tax=Niabella drilacis (strain DSM 25811 / CCM 8410 / CCUG 62505 / LMG 26954 / E90) TaxID=1285928 RepID=A0A1G6VHD9_NIADE|nr:C40 family peptidase [Niabella drilacis]SDD52911.1 SH3 domain-containing protein [Niabella drilacis]